MTSVEVEQPPILLVSSLLIKPNPFLWVTSLDAVPHGFLKFNSSGRKIEPVLGYFKN